jgi:predicted CXXCH cytochrome family protein
MKRLHALIGLAALAGIVAGGIAMADLTGSKHDFSNKAWAEGEKCGACHTPHSSVAPKAPPAWEPNADLNRRFGTTVPVRQRTDRRMQVGPSQPGNRRLLVGRMYDPGAGTLSCLRCHDGSIANDLVPGARPFHGPNSFHPGTFAAGHGRSDHPVGVEYPQNDRGYQPVNVVTSRKLITLPDNKVECMSCHDPHNEAGNKAMLVMSNSGSAMCLSCHRK